MIIFIDKQGRVSQASNEVPRARHWDIYRRANDDQRGLVELMELAIKEAVDRCLGKGLRVLNSTWLGSEILGSWEHADEWNAFCGEGTDMSGTLFGEIMWTVMFKDALDWYTMTTTEANANREERVYFLTPAP